MLRRTASITMLLSLVVPLAGTTAVGAEPSPEPEAAPRAWLSGAFGRVLGGDPATPSGSAPGNAALDAWVRGAQLTLETDVAFEDLLGVSVISRSLDQGAPDEQLSAGATVFAGPDNPGIHVVSAVITTDPSAVSEHAWLVEVPDREGGEEALLDIPGPVGVLTSSGGSVSGEPGRGCYAYLCVEVGYRPPPKTLEALPVVVGETATLGLSDGSAMVGWKGTLTPLGETPSEGIHAEGSLPSAPRAELRLAGLEATVAGEWLLELRADYDRERGWQWFLYRLVSE